MYPYEHMTAMECKEVCISGGTLIHKSQGVAIETADCLSDVMTLTIVTMSRDCVFGILHVTLETDVQF